MSVLMCAGTMKQIKLNLLLSVLLLVAIYSHSASAARLLPEDRDFSISHTTANPAAFDLKLNFTVDGSSSQQPKLHSDVARSNSPCDGIGNVLDANDVAHPRGLNTNIAETAEISIDGKDIHRTPRGSSSSGYNNKIAKEFVFNAFSKWPVTPSVSSHKGYATVTEHRLSASKPSRVVGQMQIRYARTNTMLRSKRKPGVRHMQESSQRILGSVPSPGHGN